MIDINIFSGEYPFRHLPETRNKGLLQLMDKIGCEKCVATSFPSIFYKDCLDGLRKTIEETEGCGERVFHYAVINPVFPGWQNDLDEALKLTGVVGIRLFPRYHHYALSSEELLKLMEIAAERGIPVNLSARLVDDRLEHGMVNVLPPFEMHEIEIFLKKCHRTTIILSMFYAEELETSFMHITGKQVTILEEVKKHPKTFIDIGCVKPSLFRFEGIIKKFDPSRLVIGTGAPLFYHVGTLLSFQKAQVEPQVKEKILNKNAARLFGFGGSHANH